MNDDELLRYSRHIMLPQIDIAGQESLCSAKVLIVGVGGLGSPVAMYLAASGIGELLLVDDDRVDASNLQRQIIHDEGDIGCSKVLSAQQTINRLNSKVITTTFDTRFDEKQLKEKVQDVDVVVDCSDNFFTRKLLNKICFELKIPLVSGAAIRMEGQLTVFDFRNVSSPCYQCLYDLTDEENLTCSESGVLSPLVGVVGAMQAVEVIKLISHVGDVLTGRLGLYNSLSGEWSYIRFKKDKDCAVCG